MSTVAAYQRHVDFAQPGSVGGERIIGVSTMPSFSFRSHRDGVRPRVVVEKKPYTLVDSDWPLADFPQFHSANVAQQIVSSRYECHLCE